MYRLLQMLPARARHNINQSTLPNQPLAKILLL